MAENDDNTMNRRTFVWQGIGTVAAIAVGTLGGMALTKSSSGDTVWQLDPEKCVQCERCSTHCVLTPSAVKCVHSYDMCGYCDLCGGYFQPGAPSLDTGAENQLCPTGAIKRSFVEDPYFKYDIDEKLCNGCGKCVKGCNSFGNGSLQLQVRHDICVNCNQCAIARVCPADAYTRVPAESPYLIKGYSPQKGKSPEETE